MPPRKPEGMVEQFFDALFPIGGINIATEYELQPPQTTRVGTNVRGCEPGTLRFRGGSRPGISKYVSSGPVSGQLGQRVQCLDLIVDPQEANLLGAIVQANPPIGSTADPSSPLASGGGLGPGAPPSRPRTPPGGSLVPPGGTGAAPNPHNGQPVKPSAINLTAGVLLSGSGTNYQVSLLVSNQLVTASPLMGTDNEVVGQGCVVAIVYIGGKYLFSPLLWQTNP